MTTLKVGNKQKMKKGSTADPAGKQKMSSLRGTCAQDAVIARICRLLLDLKLFKINGVTQNHSFKLSGHILINRIFLHLLSIDEGRLIHAFQNLSSDLNSIKTNTKK